MVTAPLFSSESKIILFYSGVIIGILLAVLFFFFSGCSNSDDRASGNGCGVDFNDCSVYITDCGDSVSVYRSIAEFVGTRGAMVAVFSGPCPYCKMEAMFLESAYKKYGPRGIEFINVILADDQHNYTKEYTVAAACKYREEYRFTFISAGDDMMDAFLGVVQGVPDNFFIDPSGISVSRVTGFNEDDIVFSLENLAGGT